MPLNFTTSRPAAKPTVDNDIKLSAVVTELPNDGGFRVDIMADGPGLTPAPLTISASLQKDSDAVAGNFPTINVGDSISGTGIANGTKVIEVSADGIVLSKAATAEATDMSLTITSPAGVKLCSLPIALNQANDPTLGTVLELAVKMVSSQGEKVLGTAQLTLDTELSFNRVPRK